MCIFQYCWHHSIIFLKLIKIEHNNYDHLIYVFSKVNHFNHQGDIKMILQQYV